MPPPKPTDLNAELSGLLHFVVASIKATDNNADYHAHGPSKYQLVGNVLAAIPYSRDTPWSAWRAYHAEDHRILYSPDLPFNQQDAEAVRVLVHEQFQRQALEGEIETAFGKYYCAHGMLLLETAGRVSGWSIHEQDFKNEMSPEEMEGLREYYKAMITDYENDMINFADNENEKRIDAYYSRGDLAYMQDAERTET